jgi:tRNA-specific 2-thiouridylase
LLTVRTRYRAALESCELTIDDQTAELNLNHEIRAITPGQSAVIYSNDLVLGGGIVI